MNTLDKKTILLLGHNVWQERSLELVLRLGGYDPRVVDDSQEAINVAKSLEDEVHSIVLPANGNQRILNERLDAFCKYDVTSSVVLVGMTDQDLLQTDNLGECREGIKLTACWVDQLLDCLNQ